MGAGETGNGRKCKGSVWLRVRAGVKKLKSVWWKYEIKAAVRRKEDAWKEVLAASDEEAKKTCMKMYKEEKRNVKRCIYQSKKKVNEVWKEYE